MRARPLATVDRTKARTAAAIWLLFGLVVGFHPILRNGLERPLAGYPDNELIAFLLENLRASLADGPSGRAMFHPPIFHPFAESGALSEIQLGVIPFYGPGRALGLAPLGASLSSLAIQSAITFLLAFAVLRRGLDARPHEAGFGAFLIAFGAPKIAQVYHPQLFAQVPFYVALLLAQRGLEKAAEIGPRWRSALILAALATAQLYSCVYVALLALFFALVCLPFLAVFREERERLCAFVSQNRIAVLVLLLAFVVLTAPLLLRYVAASGEARRPELARLVELQPPPLALLNAGDRSWLGRPLARWTGIPTMPFAWEFSLGLGIVTSGLVLAGAGAALRRPWLRILLAGSALAWLAVVRWPGGFSPWRSLLELMPALGVMRAISRLYLILLPILVATALLGLRTVERRWGKIASAMLVIVACAEQLRGWGMAAQPMPLSGKQIAAAIPRDCPSFFLSWRADEANELQLQLAAMWAAGMTGVPTINGYSGYPPEGWWLKAANEAKAAEHSVADRLAAWLDRSGYRGEYCWLRVDLTTPDRPSFSLERRHRP